MPYTTTARVVDRRPLLTRRTLQQRLDALARTHRVPGAQLAVHTGTEVLSVSTGVADAVTGTPMTGDTAVPLGSLTKTYTAAAVALLADDGDLDLDDPVAEFAPELRQLPDVTIRQVLSHTAGLPTGPDSDTAARTTVSRYLTTVCTARDTLFAPGSGFSYSNAGYVAAGRVVAAVTGMTWQEAVRALLLEPLGTVPAFLGEAYPARPAASGHARNTASGRLLPARQNLAPVEAPAGGLLASAADLLTLGRAVAGRSAALPAAAAADLRSPQPHAVPAGLADGWGPGLALFRQDGLWWCGHDGNAQGTSCHLRAEPDSGVVVAFTGNSGGATALWEDLADDLAHLTGLRVPARCAPVRRGPAVALPECAGTYRNGRSEYRITLGADGSPALSVDGDLPIPLICYQDLSCDLVDPATGRPQPGGLFHRDPATGVIDRVQISGRAARRDPA
ncbi:serine hydrolase domain-containing protein [Streptomyces sp. NPDC085946]|uniref:serine hydrolase domain-containing protein n=1 Tax=Streptomyces sp. NPDC085946 TaxID=3365744 RepID=UPI0037CD91D9